jgi:hypothetical protein
MDVFIPNLFLQKELFRTQRITNLNEQILEVQREIEERTENYMRFVQEGKIATEDRAIVQLNLMRDVLATLKSISGNKILQLTNLEDQIEEVRREIYDMRPQTYRRMIGRSKLSQEQADRQTKLMTDVIMTLKSLR